jgi:choline-sulfatase
MIRQAAWKLVYYHNQPPQLFNLAEDPDEHTNRAEDPACQSIRRDLTAWLLDGWDPEAIAAKLDAQRADNQVLREWGRQVRPPDVIRWDLRPEMNYLDDWDENG